MDIQDTGHRPDPDDERNNFRVKPSKNMVAFIRKRNLSNIKEHLQSQ